MSAGTQVKNGEKVNALIYNRSQKWMDGIVVGMTSEKEMKEGYRFGIFVEIQDGSIHWVAPSDVKRLEG